MLQIKPSKRLRQITAWIPHNCALCYSLCRDGICTECEDRYFHHALPRCQQCAIPVTANGEKQIVCGNCLAHPPSFDQTIAATSYRPPVDQLVQSLKFGGNLALANLMAQWMEKAIRNRYVSGEALPLIMTVVPLSPKRLSSRGFNQALEITKPLASSLKIPLIPDLAYRRRDTVPQTTIKLSERRKNMRDAFAVSDAALSFIEGKHIGIVDDVLTTGETLHELALSLKKAGAERVSCFVFARTPP